VKAVLSVPEYLKSRLSPDAYDLLAQASRDWTEPLFEKDPETGRYECALCVDEEDELDPDLLDALLTACERLSEADQPIDPDDPVLVHDAGSAGQIVLSYRFDPDEAAVFRHFRRLVEENLGGDEGIEAQFQKYSWGFAVSIRVQFQSDFDYQQKKGLIDWFLEVARRRAGGRPILGNQL